VNLKFWIDFFNKNQNKILFLSIWTRYIKGFLSKNYNLCSLVIFLINYALFNKIAWAEGGVLSGDYCKKISTNYRTRIFEQLIEFEKYQNFDILVANFKKPYSLIFFDKNFVEPNEIFLNLCNYNERLNFNFDIVESELYNPELYESEIFRPKFVQNICQNKVQIPRQIRDFCLINPIAFSQKTNSSYCNQNNSFRVDDLKLRLIILLLKKQIIEFEKFQISRIYSLAIDQQIKSLFGELGLGGSKEIAYLMISSQSSLKGFVNQYFKNLGSFIYQTNLLREKITIFQKILSIIDEKILIESSLIEKNFGNKNQLFNLEKQRFYLIFQIQLAKNEFLFLNYKHQIFVDKNVKKTAQKILNSRQAPIEIISE